MSQDILNTNHQNAEACIHKHYWMQLLRSQSLEGVTDNQILSAETLANTRDDNHISWQSFKQHLQALLDAGKSITGLLDTADSLSSATHGPLGLAALSASKVEDSLKIISTHVASRQTIVNFNLVPSSTGLRLVFEPQVERCHLYNLFESATLLNIINIICSMAAPLPANALRTSIVLDSVALRNILEGLNINTPSYGEPVTEITFSNECLQIPSIYADKATCQTNLLKCYKDKIQNNKDKRSTEDKMASLFEDYFAIRQLEIDNDLSATPAPSMDSVAKQLCMSPRTLHRRLQASETTFKALWQTHRQRQAEKLLINSQQSIAQIAELIGYHDTGNFIRAFKQWNQLSPSQWRNQQLE